MFVFAAAVSVSTAALDVPRPILLSRSHTHGAWRSVVVDSHCAGVASQHSVVDRPLTTVRRLRGGGGGSASMWADLGISVLVLGAVATAAHSGSTLMAAVFSTAPTGVPLSLWLVHRAASTEGGSLALESFLRSCIKGVLALGCFCFGALALVRLRPSPADGSLPSVGALLAAGYTGWAVAWMVLRSV